MINNIKKFFKSVFEDSVCNKMSESSNQQMVINNKEIEDQEKKRIQDKKDSALNSINRTFKSKKISSSSYYYITRNIEIEKIEFEKYRSSLYIVVYSRCGNGDLYSDKFDITSNIFYFNSNDAVNSLISNHVQRKINRLKKIALDNDCDLLNTTGSYSPHYSSFKLRKYNKNRTNVEEVVFSFMVKDTIESKIDILEKAILSNGVDINEWFKSNLYNA